MNLVRRVRASRAAVATLSVAVAAGVMLGIQTVKANALEPSIARLLIHEPAPTRFLPRIPAFVLSRSSGLPNEVVGIASMFQTGSMTLTASMVEGSGHDR